MKKVIFPIILALICGIVFLTCGGSENNRANSVVKNDDAMPKKNSLLQRSKIEREKTIYEPEKWSTQRGTRHRM